MSNNSHKYEYMRGSGAEEGADVERRGVERIEEKAGGKAGEAEAGQGRAAARRTHRGSSSLATFLALGNCSLSMYTSTASLNMSTCRYCSAACRAQSRETRQCDELERRIEQRQSKARQEHIQYVSISVPTSTVTCVWCTSTR